MPKKLHRCAMKLQASGRSEQSSWRICNASQKKHESVKRREKRSY